MVSVKESSTTFQPQLQEILEEPTSKTQVNKKIKFNIIIFTKKVFIYLQRLSTPDLTEASNNLFQEQLLLEINKEIMNNFYTFKNDSELCQYIQKEIKGMSIFFTLSELLTSLKTIILKYQLFDVNDPSLILCNGELETALNTKSLNVIQLIIAVEAQLNKIPDPLQTILRQASDKYKKREIDEQSMTSPAKTPAMNQDLESDSHSGDSKKREIVEQSMTPLTKKVKLNQESELDSNSDSDDSMILSDESINLVTKTVQTIQETESDYDLDSDESTCGTLKTKIVSTKYVIHSRPSSKEKPNIYQNPASLFYLSTAFESALKELIDFPKQRHFFTYTEISSMLSQYILGNKERLFDPRNICVAFVKDDPLGAAFGVDAFHRCQITSLMRKQIIYAGQKIAL